MIDYAETGLAVLHPSELMLDTAYDLHRKFNKEVWGERESFHNEEHIKAVAKSSDTITDAAQTGDDPLNLISDLRRWNEDPSRKGCQIRDLMELKKVFRIAIASHDRGNIAQDMRVVDGRVVVDFLPGYRSGGNGSSETAEDRSKRFVEVDIQSEIDLTEGLGIDGLLGEKERFTPFAKYLIEETRFMFSKDDPNGDRPFARAMRIFDQIGNDMFSTNDDRVIGLLREQVDENPEALIEPHFYYNFVLRRLDTLIPDKMTQKRVFKIWGKEIPSELTEYSKNKVKVKDYLLAHDMIMKSPEGLSALVEREFKEATGLEIKDIVGNIRGVDELAPKKEEEKQTL